MPDRTIPFYNTIMKCSEYICRNVDLPDISMSTEQASAVRSAERDGLRLLTSVCSKNIREEESAAN